MDGADGSRLIVLSADDGCCERMERLCRRAGYPPPRRVSYPAELRGALGPGQGSDGGRRRAQIGVAVDLTTPTPATRPDSGIPGILEAEQAARLAWCVATLSAAVAASPAPPLLLLTTNAHVGAALRSYGFAVAAQVAPGADEVAWRAALDQLVAYVADRDCAPRDPRPEHAALPPNAFRLRPGLWLDLYGCALRDDDGGRVAMLTGQEAAMLAVLADPPGRFRSAAELARLPARPSGLDSLDRHNVQQTISELRRKLGETAQRARLAPALPARDPRHCDRAPPRGGPRDHERPPLDFRCMGASRAPRRAGRTTRRFGHTTTSGADNRAGHRHPCRLL